MQWPFKLQVPILKRTFVGEAINGGAWIGKGPPRRDGDDHAIGAATEAACYDIMVSKMPRSQYHLRVGRDKLPCKPNRRGYNE